MRRKSLKNYVIFNTLSQDYFAVFISRFICLARDREYGDFQMPHFWTLFLEFANYDNVIMSTASTEVRSLWCLRS